MSEELIPDSTSATPPQKHQVSRIEDRQGLSFPGVFLDAASLASLDIEKFERIMAMKERSDELALEAQKRDQEAEFDRIMSEFQKRMPLIERTKDGPKGNWKYAPLEEIMRKAKPILGDLGITVSYEQEEEEKSMTITCVVRAAGHTRRTPYRIPKDPPIVSNSGYQVTTNAQAQASTVSQARRHAFCLALNVVCEDEDNDGGDPHAQTGGKITSFQLQQLEKEIESLGKDLDTPAFLKHFGLDALPDMEARKFPVAMQKLQAKKRRASQGVQKPPAEGKVKATIDSVEEESGKNAKGPWTVYHVFVTTSQGESFKASTFSKTLGTKAQEITGQTVEIETKVTTKGVNLLKIHEPDHN